MDQKVSEANKSAGSTSRFFPMLKMRSKDGFANPHSIFPMVPVDTEHNSANSA